MRTLAKILVTKSIRLMMKRMRNLPRNPPDRSARFELNHPVFMTIADLCPHLFSALLLPNRRSRLQGLREISPHHPRSRLLSPSKRVMRSKHPDPMPFIFTISVFVSCFHGSPVHTTVSRYLSTYQTNIGDSIVPSQLHYICYKQIPFLLRGDKQQSAQLRYHLYTSIHAFFPSFSMTSCERNR